MAKPKNKHKHKTKQTKQNQKQKNIIQISFGVSKPKCLNMITKVN